MKHSIPVRFSSPRRRIARLSAAAALAVTMGIAMPTAAQVLPEISLRITPGYSVTNESLIGRCAVDNGLPAQIRASSNAQGVSVNIFAYTVSGHDRFRDYGVPAYMEGSRAVYRQRSQARYTSNNTNWADLNSSSFSGAGSPCFADDLLITGDSVVRVVLMRGTGYTINPNMRSVDITVRDTPNERCDLPSNTPGGKYYMPHPQGGLAYGVCTCSAEGPWYPQQRLVNGNRVWVNKGDDDYDEAYGAVQRGWRSDTTNYCPGSPYQGPS